MTYQETCDYLYSQMPMFERQGASGYKEGLSNTQALDEHFGHLHQSFATIHVAGTNGKGSVSHMLASVLQECGYIVGLYTSPHLVDFRERIRINGRPISEEYVVDFVERERAFFEPLHPSFFEVTTALAFKYFSDKHVDIAIVEVGLGGRRDCTNSSNPIVSVITNISFDHQQFLGETLDKIASEKAGIIKRGTPVIIGENHPQTRPVFEAKAKEMGAPIIFAEDEPEVISAQPTPDGGMHYETKHVGVFDGDLGGIYQQKNLNTVLYTLKMVEKLGYLCFPGLNCIELHNGVGKVCSNTGLMGRWQTIQQHPHVVCDTGHNVGGWQYLSRQLAMVKCEKMHIVFGMVNDKDIDSVLELLPKQAIYYFTKANTKRALNEQSVRLLAVNHGISGSCYPSVDEAYSAAMEQAGDNDFVFIGGSSYVVGDFLKNCI